MNLLHLLKLNIRFTLFIFFLVALQGMSQDTIHFMNYDVKIVKVEEVGLNDVKYHRFENLTGPLYIAAKTEIDYIVYANGQLEKMKNVPGSSAPAFSSAPATSASNPFAPRITVIGSRMFYRGERMSDRGFGALIDRYPKPEIKLRLENEYELLTKYKRNSVIWKIVALGVGIGAPVIGTVVYVGSDGATIPGIGLLTSIVAGTTGSVLTKMYRNKHKAKLREMATIYNGTN